MVVAQSIPTCYRFGHDNHSFQKRAHRAELARPATRVSRVASDQGRVMRDFVNFFDLDPASLELSRQAVAEAPPLGRKQIDVISTIFGWTPVAPEAELT